MKSSKIIKVSLTSSESSAEGRFEPPKREEPTESKEVWKESNSKGETTKKQKVVEIKTKKEDKEQIKKEEKTKKQCPKECTYRNTIGSSKGQFCEEQC